MLNDAILKIQSQFDDAHHKLNDGMAKYVAAQINQVVNELNNYNLHLNQVSQCMVNYRAEA